MLTETLLSSVNLPCATKEFVNDGINPETTVISFLNTPETWDIDVFNTPETLSILELRIPEMLDDKLLDAVILSLSAPDTLWISESEAYISDKSGISSSVNGLKLGYPGEHGGVQPLGGPAKTVPAPCFFK